MRIITRSTIPLEDVDMEKIKSDKIKVAFTREEINGVGVALRAFMQTCMDIGIGKEALNIYTRILKYGRPYLHKNIEYVAVFFYRSEFSNLMRIVSLYAYAGSQDSEDFYNKIGKCEADENVFNAIKKMEGI